MKEARFCRLTFRDRQYLRKNFTMAQFRNFKMVSYVVFGRGSFNQLDEILASTRKKNLPIIFLVDHFFSSDSNESGQQLLNRVPLRGNDKIVFADVTYEPKTSYVD